MKFYALLSLKHMEMLYFLDRHGSPDRVILIADRRKAKKVSYV